MTASAAATSHPVTRDSTLIAGRNLRVLRMNPGRLAVAWMLGFRVRTGLPGMAGITAVTVAFGLAIAVTSAWLALMIQDAETAERVLFFPSIAIALVSSAFAIGRARRRPANSRRPRG